MLSVCFQVQIALDAAPQPLRLMGLAFRVFLMTSTAAGGTPAARLASQISKQYRLFIDPVLTCPTSNASTQHSASALGNLSDTQQAAGTSFVGLSAAVVCFASEQLFNNVDHRAELHEAYARGCQLIVLAAPGLTYEQAVGPAADRVQWLAEQVNRIVDTSVQVTLPCRVDLDTRLSTEIPLQACVLCMYEAAEHAAVLSN